MRCNKCGSANIDVEVEQKSKFSWKKGFLGTLIFGNAGAVAGVGGKTETNKRYHCKACGQEGIYSWVIMDPETTANIDIALQYNDVAKLKDYKRRYRNIEWTPPAQTESKTPALTGGAYRQTQTMPINRDFEIVDGKLNKYSGSGGAISIPQGVVTIGERAFEKCENLTSVTIPRGVTSIEDLAFSFCKNLTSITLPDSIISIGKRVFLDCKNLTSVSLPNSVISIGEGVFSNCTNLTSVTIPNSVITIGHSAFFDCENLKSIIIPKSVTSIGDNIFLCCVNLETITVEEGNPYYRSDGNCLIRVVDNTIISGCKNSEIPDYVTSIGVEAFKYCKNVTIVLPNGIKSIGPCSFQACKNLTSITIPHGVTSIGDRAFSNCKNLASVTIPDSVTSIGEGAFSGCENLTSVIIPKSVTSIESNIFSLCDKLEMISVEEGNPYYRSDGNCLIRIADNTVLTGCKNSKIPDYVTSIGKEAFSYINQESPLIIPKSIIRIEDEAYAGCGADSIIIPEKVNFIGKEAITDDIFRDFLKTVTFSDPHGWALITNNSDNAGKPIDVCTLSDPNSAAKFIRMNYYYSLRKNS